ncbi:MAG TPA: low specificity L-threonine aldolase [Chthoniobacterales bacterium]|jgi:threonine aldolase|nr:low specificity L-threonine aldolase [Chthoniobacterales bacterium]
MPIPPRHQFASDNTAGICPEAWAALAEANHDAAVSYAEDSWTRRVREQVREIFETDCESFLVFNGTAANSLALAQLCRPFESVLCHERAHVETDECGAPEFFSGGAKLLKVGGENGKIDLSQAADVMGQHRDVHSTRVRAMSITQATEAGTLYSPAELETIAAFAAEHSLALHMDGARFANAIASLGCKPKEITWERGVRVLSLGGTKNGLAVGELVVFFERALAREFEYRVKQGGQLASKTRFLAAPWNALLADDIWLKNARHGNEMARLLEEKLAKGGLRLAFPREANALFVRLPNDVAERLQARGWHFYNFFEPGVYRLMCSWATTEADVEAFATDVDVALRATRE